MSRRLKWKLSDVHGGCCSNADNPCDFYTVYNKQFVTMVRRNILLAFKGWLNLDHVDA